MPIYEAHVWLVLWPARLAVLCYLLRALFDVASLHRVPGAEGTSPGRERWLECVRIVWTAGWVLYLEHVVAAFGVHYQWSHEIAVEETARRIPEFGGTSWGLVGMLLNHLVTLVWSLDVWLWWRRGATYPDDHPTRITLMHVFLAFMTINATVVFGPRGWRYVTFAFVLLAGGLAAFSGRRPDRGSTG